MSNSSLASYKHLSANCTSPRWGRIQYITIHCYVGQVTAKQGCDRFAPSSKKASANYVVGYDGSIGLCVDESNRAWTTGGDKTINGITGSLNDHRAVTIEVACETTHPYKVTDAAYKSLIKLVADIAKRNNLGELKWKADKSLVGHPDKQNMTVHRWFKAKACPGDYLYGRMSDICSKANAINKEEADMTRAETESLIKQMVPDLVKQTYLQIKQQENAERSEKEVSDWARSYVEKAVKAGLMSQDPDAEPDEITIDRPLDYTTREELATVLARVMDVLNKMIQEVGSNGHS